MVRSEAALTRRKAPRRKKLFLSYFFLLGALRLVNAASPRTFSIDKKKISSGTQGISFPTLITKLQSLEIPVPIVLVKCWKVVLNLASNFFHCSLWKKLLGKFTYLFKSVFHLLTLVKKNSCSQIWARPQVAQALYDSPYSFFYHWLKCVLNFSFLSLPLGW